MVMYSFFVGIDVSKETLDVAYYAMSKPRYAGQFSNQIAGFRNMIRELKKVTSAVPEDWFICFENTGTYSKTLLNWLFSQGIACREENALTIHKSKGLQRGKDDKIDARVICQYLYLHREKLAPTKPTNPAIYQLKKLLSRRNLLVRKKSALQVSLKEQRKEYDPDIYRFLVKQNNQLLDMIQQQIKQVEQLINKLIKKDPKLEDQYNLIQSVKGIGPIIAAYLLAYTENFARFKNARKFACYCGIAPFPNSSGKTLKGKNKVSHMANKQIKALLTNGANAAVRWDNEMNLYYHKKIGEGKEYGTVINAIKNKIVARAFAVVSRRTPYVCLATYA